LRRGREDRKRHVHRGGGGAVRGRRRGIAREQCRNDLLQQAQDLGAVAVLLYSSQAQVRSPEAVCGCCQQPSRLWTSRSRSRYSRPGRWRFGRPNRTRRRRRSADSHLVAYTGRRSPIQRDEREPQLFLDVDPVDSRRGETSVLAYRKSCGSAFLAPTRTNTEAG
jgi:hypothetical protein